MIDLARIGVCRGCGDWFVSPVTGPLRVYCGAKCRDETHALRTLDPLDRDGLEGLAERPVPARPTDSFSLRFRDADELAWRFELVLRGDPCCYCGSRENFQVDHIQSFISGGSGEWQNCTASCRECNSSKCATPLLWWLLSAPRMLALRYPQLQLEGLAA